MQPLRTGTESFLSLERKLPMLIGGLVAAVLLTTLFLVYVELRDSAVQSGADRLRHATEELVELAATGTAGRNRILADVAGHPAVRALVRGDSSARDEARARLATLRVRSDSLMPLQILDADGSVIEQQPAAPPTTLAEAPAERPQTGDSATYTPFATEGDRLTYWVTTPIRDGDAIIGHIAQKRSVSAGAAGEQIEQLIGNETDVFFANRSGSAWVALQGGVVQAPPQVDTTGAAFTYENADGERYFAYALPLPQTPWMVVTHTPWRAVIARSNDVLRRVALVGLGLMLLGGIAAWLLSRSVTRPLRELGRAADAIARGDYSRRTGITRHDEIGRVAGSFDAMASHVDATHAELERRFRHAQQLAAELEVARIEALQANRAKSDFLATMSHEIRTPINAVIGYTDLLDAGVAGELPPAQRNYVERIRLSSEHLITVVNDVLDFAKIESGQMRMSPASHPAAAALTSAAAILHARALARGIDVHLDCAPGIRYFADEHRVQQILLNLLSNALKFSPEGGRVDVACDSRSSHAARGAAQPERQWTCITVTDAGPGVPPDQLERIFEPFIQGAAGYTRPHGGTGLGLAIARSLARMMGGDITVLSTPGEGASFTLWLPQHD